MVGDERMERAVPEANRALVVGERLVALAFKPGRDSP